MKSYFALGLMSGTSLDGLDICYVKFPTAETENFEILQAETIPYDQIWKSKLKNSIVLTAEELTRLDFDYGIYLGKTTKAFIQKHQIQQLDFIASHGHTVFHNPAKNYTLQIGKGQGIFTETGIRTVFDFRSQDVLLGGQGAPLVPIGDEILFKNYDACLNLGGFSNISFQRNGKREAFDICPVNVVLNQLSEELGKNYDENGEMARSGKLLPELLDSLNSFDFYQNPPPKSLGLEWCLENVFPLLKSHSASIPNLLSTFTAHIADQIAKVLNENAIQDVLVTGGGTYNDFLIQSLDSKTKTRLIIPNKKLIDFKEALVFALMGFLRLENRINVLSSVTGAAKNHSSGIVVN